MKLSTARTQDELIQCTNHALRRALWAGSPLNIAMVGIWVLVYIFMPAAIFGSGMGILGTIVLASVAAYLWSWSTPEALNLYLCIWLAWSVLDVLVTMAGSLVFAVQRYRRGRAFILPSQDQPAELAPGAQVELPFEKGESCSREIVVHAPSRGVYVFSSHVLGEDAKADVQLDDRACMTESEHVPALVSADYAAYRLEAGCHRLRVCVQSVTASRIMFCFR